MRHGKTTSILMALCFLLVACATADDGGAVSDETVAIALDSTGTVPASSAEASTAPAGGEVEAAGVLTYPIVSTGQSACYDDAGWVIACPAERAEFFGQDGSYVGTEAIYPTTEMGRSPILSPA